MRGFLVARLVAVAASMMLAGSCTVGPGDSNTTFGGPGSAGGPGGDTAVTSEDQSTSASASGTATHGSTTSVADETADASSSAMATGASTSAGSSGEATTTASSVGSTGEDPVCDAFCRGCACPSNMCTMCCAGQGMVDQCVGGSCFCF